MDKPVRNPTLPCFKVRVSAAECVTLLVPLVLDPRLFILRTVVANLVEGKRLAYQLTTAGPSSYGTWTVDPRTLACGMAHKNHSRRRA